MSVKPPPQDEDGLAAERHRTNRARLPERLRCGMVLPTAQLEQLLNEGADEIERLRDAYLELRHDTAPSTTSNCASVRGAR